MISGYLELPLSTVQLALRQLVNIASRVQTEEIEVDQEEDEKKDTLSRLIKII